MSCGQVHSQAHQLVAAGQTAQLVAETLEISRSSPDWIAGRHAGRAPIAATTNASSRSAAKSQCMAIAGCNGGWNR